SLLLALSALVVLAGCGTNAGSAGNLPKGTDGFQLSVLDGSFAVGGSLSTAAVHVSLDTPTHVVVDVDVAGAQGVKALMLKLAYDPALYRPMVAEPGAAL